MTRKHADDGEQQDGEKDADDRRARRKRKERRRNSHGRAVIADQKELDSRQAADVDDDANADLSLQIVEKAEKRRRKSGRGRDDPNYEAVNVATTPVRDSDAEDSMDEDDFVKRRRTRSNYVLWEARGKEPASRSETPEEGELQEDGDGNLVLATELRAVEITNEVKGKKKKKKKKKDKKKGGNVVAEPISEKELVIEVEDGVADESMVMRKLLRGPRYFDPPEDQSESCFNCGKFGHIAIACPEGPRLKPCYVCGEFEHDGRDCPKKTECYVCGKMGHIAKNCPNKGSRTTSAREVDNVCLLCGRGGHDTSTCYYSYDPRDLEQVQCYVCKNFGHLCCVVIVDTSPQPVSCFLCGEMGHTGMGCSRRNSKDKERPSVCYTCGEEGHYARGCTKGRGSRTRSTWPQEGQTLAVNEFTSRMYTPRSDGRAPLWMDLQQRENRWSFSQRIKAEDRWTGSRIASDYERADDAPHVGVSNQDSDYMGPIDNFVDSSKDGYHSRRRKRWTRQ